MLNFSGEEYENNMQKIEYKSRYLKHIDNEIIF